MTKPRRRSFIVHLDLPEGATIKDGVEYIKSGIEGERGILHPDDPMFNLERSSVKVTYAKPRSRRKRDYA